jgi:hypothetical protein
MDMTLKNALDIMRDDQKIRIYRQYNGEDRIIARNAKVSGCKVLSQLNSDDHSRAKVLLIWADDNGEMVINLAE